jgi:hypothetical protein
MITRFSLIFIAILGLYGCSSTLKVYSTQEKDVDFKSYKTFDFYEIREEHLQMKEVNRRRLAMAIELELGYKGYKRSVNKPDLLVNIYSLINRTENVNTSNTSSVGYYGAATPYGAGIGVSVSPKSKYSEYYSKGTVTIDLVDRVKNRLVLEGVAKIDAGSGDDANRIINYTVKEVFKKIPDAVKRR